jgi:hypothetical protein
VRRRKTERIADANNHLHGGYTYEAADNMLHDATANLNYSYDKESHRLDLHVRPRRQAGGEVERKHSDTLN